MKAFKYNYKYRDMRFTVKKRKFGDRQWKVHFDGVLFFGYTSFDHTYPSKSLAVFSAQKQINGILGKRVQSVLEKVF